MIGTGGSVSCGDHVWTAQLTGTSSVVPMCRPVAEIGHRHPIPPGQSKLFFQIRVRSGTPEQDWGRSVPQPAEGSSAIDQAIWPPARIGTHTLDPSGTVSGTVQALRSSTMRAVLRGRR